jgi:phenylacetate-CoA ligase
LFGRIIVLPEIDRPPFWRYDAAQKNLLFSSYHLSEKNLPFYVKKLKDYHPEEIVGYPSSLYHLSLYIVEKGLEGKIKPQVVFTTAENLLSYQRKIIRQAFKCPVINQYGCTEMAMFASECEHGKLHLHPEHGFVEVVPRDPNQLIGNEPDLVGEMVCTGFVNKAMPLIRYRLGDEVALSKSARCGCGRRFPVLEKVQGRIDDIIITPDGRPVGRLDPVFKGFSGIKECQIVQESLDKVSVNIVCDAMFDASIEAELMTEFRKRLGNEMEIELVKMTEIPKSANGKFRPVVSMINKMSDSGGN